MYEISSSYSFVMLRYIYINVYILYIIVIRPLTLNIKTGYTVVGLLIKGVPTLSLRYSIPTLNIINKYLAMLAAFKFNI